MSTTIDLNLPFVGLDGKPVANSHRGELLASHMANARLNGHLSIKFWTWARTLFAHQSIAVDEADSQLLRQWIEANGDIPVQAKAQLLEEWP